jgi:putative peptidoglycan lipid II flippase
LSSITYLSLNAYKRFAAPAVGQLAFKAIILVILVALCPVVGIFGMAIGIVFAAIVRLIVHLVALRKKVAYYRPSLAWRDSEMQQMRKLLLPLFVGIIFSQLSGIVDNMFASTLDQGSIAGLSYARKIIDLPILAIPYALGIVLFPYFSELALKEDKTELVGLFVKVLRIIILIFVPLAVLTFILRTPIVQLLFQRGQFNAVSVQLTATPLACYAVGMVAFAVEILIMQLYFSMKDTLTPVLIGIACVLVNIALTAILIRFFAHAGIALALTCSKTVKVLVLYHILKGRLRILRRHAWLAFGLKTGLSALTMAFGVLWISHTFTISPEGNIMLRQLVHLSTVTLLGSVLFIAISLILGISETRKAMIWVTRQLIGAK